MKNKIRLTKVHYFHMELIQEIEKKIEHLSYLYSSKGGDHYLQGVNILNSIREFLTGGDNTSTQQEDYDFMLNTYKECMESGVWGKKIKQDPIEDLAVEVLPEFEKISTKLVQTEAPVGELDLDTPEVSEIPEVVVEKDKKKKKTKV